jgi:hypothetical protein
MVKSSKDENDKCYHVVNLLPSWKNKNLFFKVFFLLILADLLFVLKEQLSGLWLKLTILFHFKFNLQVLISGTIF